MSNNHKFSTVMKATSLVKVSKPIQSQIVSSTPGRMRLKVDHQHRNYPTMEPIAQALKKSHLGIYDVRANPHSGSITIHHSPDHVSLDEIYRILADAGVIIGDITGARSEVADGIASTVYDLNRQVKKATSGAVDLRILMPLGLAALSVRQLLVKGWQLEIIPWYVLAWYAFDSFIKLHYTSEPKQTQR